MTVSLLSPAHRPIQVTADLKAFWGGSYREVQKEMKGRYPKHFWPDDPANAQPTKRVKSLCKCKDSLCLTDFTVSVAGIGDNSN